MKKITVVLMLIVLIHSAVNAEVITTKSFGVLNSSATNELINPISPEQLLAALPATLYYKDVDGDGFGSASDAGTLFEIVPPSGYSTNNTDCDDINLQIHPGTTEVCNYVDDDCNGLIDESGLTATVYPQGNVYFCQSVTLTASSAEEGVTYKWYRNQTPITGASNSTLNVHLNGNYYVVEAKGNCIVKSVIATATANPVPSAYAATYGPLDLCVSGSVLARANGANTGYTYQWLKSGLSIPGYTSRNATITSSGVYSVVVSNSLNCSSTSEPFIVYSSCRLEDVDLHGDLKLSIRPNPSNGKFTVDLDLGTPDNSTALIEVINMLSKVEFSTLTTLNSGILHEQITLPDNFESGMHIVRVMIGNKVYSGRVNCEK